MFITSNMKNVIVGYPTVSDDSNLGVQYELDQNNQRVMEIS